ncbi:MAG: transposase [Armatimonadota bacterium]
MPDSDDIIREFRKRRRRLPHWDDPGALYFVTTSTDPAFGSHLCDRGAAQVVYDCLLYDDGRRYALDSFVVMPDHFHALLVPMPRQNGFVPLSEIMQTIKSVSAHRINRLFGRRGSVWLEESFDRSVRTEREHASKWHYIRRNPVRAGLVSQPEDWPWLWPQPE